ncbi:MAG: hypothetical protein KatS3mg129_0978 [Leptospiraceae bacterium]|nr:MAG: hypothetical protein KatS3mg129_0978 [Leptospiraceae bacterium]
MIQVFFYSSDGINIMVSNHILNDTIIETSINKVQEISKVFKEEMMLLQKAIEIEKEKGKAILQAKTKRLQELTQRSDELLHSLIEVENQRYTLIGELIAQYKDRLNSTNINLTNFLTVIKEIKNETKNKQNLWEKTIDDLLKNLKHFKESAESLKIEVETNQKLLIRTKNIVSDIIDKIEQKDKTYLNHKKNSISSNAILVNQSV